TATSGNRRQWRRLRMIWLWHDAPPFWYRREGGLSLCYPRARGGGSVGGDAFLGFLEGRLYGFRIFSRCCKRPVTIFSCFLCPLTCASAGLLGFADAFGALPATAAAIFRV